MGEIVQYEHHGTTVSVDEELQGQHRAHCLCFRGCKRFFPDSRDKNCHRANHLFEFCVKFNMVTPVWECGEFVE